MRRLHLIPSFLIQFIMLALNLGLGIHNLHTHFRSWPSFGAAGFIAGIMIANLLMELRTRALRNRIFQLHQEAIAIMAGQELTMAYSPAAVNLARENFLKVAKAVKAEYSIEAPWLKLRTKKRTFVITYGGVQEMDSTEMICVSATCWQNNASLPPHEAVAGVALLLHNKPELFEYWRDHRGYSAS